MVSIAPRLEAVGDVLVHGPALQPVEVLVQPLVLLGDEDRAAGTGTGGPMCGSAITRRRIPPG